MACDEARLNHTLRLPVGQRVSVRPLRSQDAEVLQAYVRGLSRESRRNRFLGAVNELAPAELERLTHLDCRSQLALIAGTDVDGAPMIIGEARLAIALDLLRGEFALSVADAWQGHGLGALLLADLECRAKSLGVRWLVGDVLRSNEAMNGMARKAGFETTRLPGDARLVGVVKDISLAHAGPPCDEGAASGLPLAA
jgi:GNAT superfamily N-acetyltransferase